MILSTLIFKASRILRHQMYGHMASEGLKSYLCLFYLTARCVHSQGVPDLTQFAQNRTISRRSYVYPHLSSHVDQCFHLIYAKANCSHCLHRQSSKQRLSWFIIVLFNTFHSNMAVFGFLQRITHLRFAVTCSPAQTDRSHLTR